MFFILNYGVATEALNKCEVLTYNCSPICSHSVEGRSDLMPNYSLGMGVRDFPLTSVLPQPKQVR